MNTLFQSKIVRFECPALKRSRPYHLCDQNLLGVLRTGGNEIVLTAVLARRCGNECHCTGAADGFEETRRAAEPKSRTISFCFGVLDKTCVLL